MGYGSRQLSLCGRETEVGRVVFDSGSSYTYFTKQTYSDFVASVSLINCSPDKLKRELLFKKFFHWSSLILLSFKNSFLQLTELPMEGLIQDTSDPTLPICWGAKFPIRYDRIIQKLAA